MSCTRGSGPYILLYGLLSSPEGGGSTGEGEDREAITVTDTHSRANSGSAGQDSIRRQNLASVLREVMENGALSRAGIAAAVGLSRSTVSRLVGELIDRGFLVDQDLERDGAVGRPGRLVAVSDTKVVALGLEINVDYLAACVRDLAGNIRYERFLRHDNRKMPLSVILDALADLAERAVDSVEGEGLVTVGTTLAVPGLVDHDSGILLIAPNLGWKDVSLGEELTCRLGWPGQYVSVENEANLAALGELWIGQGHKWGDFVRFSGEIGVGGALVVNEGLLSFGSGLGGELGHVTVDPDGPECTCGSRGCLERFVGQEALLRACGFDATVGTSIALPDGGISLIVKSAQKGDLRTMKALTEAGRALGFVCGTIVNIISPDTVVLGGIYSPLFPWLAGPLREEMEKRAFLTRHSDISVARSELGPFAAVRGAATFALRAVCADPSLVGG